jgi:hypothetical protein
MLAFLNRNAHERSQCRYVGVKLCSELSVVIDIDVVLVNVEERTAYCSDGVTRTFFEMYDAEAQPTEDPDEAIAAVVKVADDQFIVLKLIEENPTELH